MEYAYDLEEGEIRELVLRAPIHNEPLSPDLGEWDRRASSQPLYYFGQGEEAYDHGYGGDESIWSSRPCTPPGLTMFRNATVPWAPGPKPLTSRVAKTPPQSPSPAPLGVENLRDAASRGSAGGTISPGSDARGRWAIPPDVCRKAEIALSRVAAMSGDSGMHYPPPYRRCGDEDLDVPPAYYPSIQAGSISSSDQRLVLATRREPPQSPLSPEELERAIRIIEELFIVDGVPPHVFIQCGVSPGTLYHAFNYLGIKLPDDLW